MFKITKKYNVTIFVNILFFLKKNVQNLKFLQKCMIANRKLGFDIIVKHSED